MNERREFEISVGTADDYKNYIAEVRFPKIGGFILSQESDEGKYEISIHSFISNQDENFDYCRNIEQAKIPLRAIEEAIALAKSELARLAKE